MRPYLAIIKDSFRAALATKVLYVLLGLITILLLAIAPFYLQETVEWKLNWQWNPPGANARVGNNVSNPEKIIERLVTRHDQPGEKPIARIWELLPQELTEKLTTLNAAGDDPDESEDVEDQGPGLSPEVRSLIKQNNELVDGLNQVIQNPDFYRPDDWANRPLPAEADGLLGQDVKKLATNRQRRLNRLLLATALSPNITRGETALDFYYGPWPIDVFSQRGGTHQQFSQLLTSQLPVYFDKFVMSIGLLIAILVTANMIPDMFEPGSLNLLLSKPIFRWGLYVSKFIGGCVFIALCAGYLFLGVWLWMGLALGVWDRAMLLSIPLYVLVFAIYFSISALVGLLYRSPTVSVILTLIFWAFCFGVGVIFNLVDNRMKNAAIMDVVPLAEGAMAVDVLQTGFQWNSSSRDWDAKLEPAMKPEERMGLGIGMFFGPLNDLPDPVGPLFNPATNQLISAKFSFQDMARRGSPRPMFVADAEQMNFVEAGQFPASTILLSLSKGKVLAITSLGEFYQLDQTALDEYLQAQLVDTPPIDESSGGQNDQDSQDEAAIQPNQRPGPLDFFELIGPNEPVDIRSSDQVALNQSNGNIAIYNKGAITVFKRVNQDYQKHASLEVNIDFNKRMSCVMDYQGSTIVLAFGNGQVITIDGESLVELNGYLPETRSPIVTVRGSPDGNWFALLYRNQKLWILDRQNDATLRKANVTGQGGISTMMFSPDSELWVADRTDRLTQYNLQTGESQQQFVPGGDWLEKTYRYFLLPFYRVCPKPGEFYKLVTHLSAAGDSQQNKDVDLRNSVERTNPWSPLWSGLAFMVALLVLACLIFQFKDY
ncbi:MAG: ABC transporter permease [Mariniblastus sp.]|nr:ABC transporter permease [Mariniblastus sp.]